MELVLPKNYVEIEEEEMMYLDGGWQFTGLYNSVVAFGINAIVNGIMGGETASTVMRILGSNRTRNEIAKYAAKYLGARAANSLAGRIVSAIFGFSSWSIGSACAKLWDKYDTNPNNGICGAPNWI